LESILSWVKQIVIFYIFSNFIIHVLPNGNYEKYIKFFIGLILIAVVISPLTGFFKLDTIFEDIYNSAISNDSISEMRMDLQYAEKTNYDSIAQPYKEEVIKNVEKIVTDNYLFPVKTTVDFDMDSESKTFGQIKDIQLQVSKKYTNENKIIVDKIKIQAENSESGTKSDSNSNLSVASITIKNSIADFYHISPDNVNISE